MDKIQLFKEAAIFMPARAHMWHLNTTTYAHHMALNDYYQELPELVDAFIEGASVYHGVMAPTGTQYVFDAGETAIDGMTQFLFIMTQVHGELQKYPGLQNTLEAMMSLTESALYKLRNLR